MTIEGNKITADEGKVLKRLSDGHLFGNELTLGYTWYIGGERIDPPLLELPEHYTDTYYIMVDGMSYAVDSFDYAYLKGFIVKIKYSNDDQIAIMLNYQNNPDNEVYKHKYEDMQAWREKAGELAVEYSN